MNKIRETLLATLPAELRLELLRFLSCIYAEIHVPCTVSEPSLISFHNEYFSLKALVSHQLIDDDVIPSSMQLTMKPGTSGFAPGIIIEDHFKAYDKSNPWIGFFSPEAKLFVDLLYETLTSVAERTVKKLIVHSWIPDLYCGCKHGKTIPDQQYVARTLLYGLQRDLLRRHQTSVMLGPLGIRISERAIVENFIAGPTITEAKHVYISLTQDDLQMSANKE